MNVTVGSQEFAAELRLVNKIVAVKPAIPILSHVLLTADADGLTLQATDYEVGLRTSCRALTSEAGTVALPAKRLLDLLEQFPVGDVHVTTEGNKVLVSSASFKSRLQALPAAEFPPQPEVEGVTVELLGLHALIAKTQHAISDKGGPRTVLNGALLSLDGVAAMIATDGKRLAVATSAYEGPVDSAIVPSKALDAILTLEGPFRFAQTARHLFFTTGTRLLTSRKIDAQFPKYDRIVPRENDKQVTVDRSLLSAAVRRVGVISESNYAAYLHVAPGLMTLTSSSAEVGDAREEVVCSYDGLPLKVCVNWRFLLDFLEAASGQTVTVALKDESTQMLLTDGDTLLGVIMLMRA